ncbi:MAG: hypothetical protein ACO3JL_14660, partial [Myxococcota bacterium]
RLRTCIPLLSHTGLSAFPFAVGVAHYLPGDDEASLLERADRDMYRDKRHARIVTALLVAA